MEILENLMRFLAVFVAVIVSVALVVAFFAENRPPFENEEVKPVYVGVAFQGETVAEAKLLIDRVQNYTNLFVIGTTPVSRNETATNEVCDYAISKGLNIIVNFGYYTQNPSSPEEEFRQWPWQHDWVEAAKQKYSNHFLGVYYDDEPGGTTLDYDWVQFFTNYSSYLSQPINSTLHQLYAKYTEAQTSGIAPSNYDLEAEYFESVLRSAFYHGPRETGGATFTSDYALYWFDYSGGYDVMLAELGWNHSTIQDIALVKGAARLQDKPWGAIITWKYEQPPYLDSGENIYSQMVQAYQAGASYITIFNYPKLEGNDYGVMLDEHFSALERFWNVVVEPNVDRPRESSSADAALVLPRNYGWGMRNPNDKIWGIWGPDDKSPQIWEISRRLLSEYGLKLDIVYDDPMFSPAGRYNRIYYWNETT